MIGETKASSRSVWGCYLSLGEFRRAIDLFEQGLAIARKIGSRESEIVQLLGLGRCDADRQAWEQAIQRHDNAIRIADETSIVEGQSEGRLGLAKIYLFRGELSAARQVAQIASTYDFPTHAAEVQLILGVVLLREELNDQARSVFAEAVVKADALLHHTSDNYRALDTKAVALCGLAVLGDSDSLTMAMAAIQAARAISRAPGVVQEVSRLLDALAVHDEGEALGQIRVIANSPPRGLL